VSAPRRCQALAAERASAEEGPVRAAQVGLSRRTLLASLAGCGAAALLSPAGAAPRGHTMQIDFRGTRYLHRWSKNGQHEFTPESEPDLKRWNDMLTLNVHEATGNGEQLADVANRVLANYQRAGKILVTRSTPRTAAKPAEHLIVAVLGTPGLLEAVFARCLLHDGAGMIAVASHRVYGQAVGPQMSEWLKANGPAVEQALMAWNGLPPPSALKALPHS